MCSAISPWKYARLYKTKLRGKYITAVSKLCRVEDELKKNLAQQKAENVKL